MKGVFVFIGFLFCSYVPILAQGRLTLSPEKPQAGGSIKITYSPAADITGSQVEGVVFTMGIKNRNLNSFPLRKVGNSYIGTVQTNQEQNFVAVGIKIDGAFDTNNGEGYFVELYQGDSIAPGADLSVAKFFSEDSYLLGIRKDNTDKAIKYYESAFEKNIDEKSKNIISFTRLQAKADITNSDKAFQNNIEWLLRKGLNTELDYYNFRVLYFYANLPEQENFVIEVMKEKFPDGQWVLGDILRKFKAEKSITKREQLLDEYISRAKKTGVSPNLSDAEEYMTETFLKAVGQTVDYKKLENIFEKYHISNNLKGQILHFVSNKLQEKNENLKQALELATQSMQIAKNEIANPSEKKPYDQTDQEWLISRRKSYASYAGTYALIEYKLGNPKTGFPLIKEAAIAIYQGENIELNNIYILYAKRLLSQRDFQTSLASFVANGAADSNIVLRLKKVYKSAVGKKSWNEYYNELQAQAAEKAKKELIKSMVRIEAPDFMLFDKRGQKVDLEALQNKVVVLDFWATWCVPCKASFPAMQEMVEKYRNDSNVVFLFIDTWERIDDKKERELAVNKFVEDHKYDFRVLFDHESKVVVSYGVSGIPTKIVIDKEGFIRFISMGYEGNIKLRKELSGMIELAKQE